MSFISEKSKRRKVSAVMRALTINARVAVVPRVRPQTTRVEHFPCRGSRELISLVPRRPKALKFSSPFRPSAIPSSFAFLRLPLCL